MNPNRRVARIIALAVGIPVAVIALLVVGVIYLFGGFRDNVAEDHLAKLTTSLDREGGHRLCGQGDAGYGPDNAQPWYKVFYQVPDATTARSAFFDAATADSYSLIPNTSVASHPKTERFYTSDPAGQEPTVGLTVVLYHDMKVTTDCDFGGAGTTTTSGKSAIYEIELTAPYVKR